MHFTFPCTDHLQNILLYRYIGLYYIDTHSRSHVVPQVIWNKKLRLFSHLSTLLKEITLFLGWLKEKHESLHHVIRDAGSHESHFSLMTVYIRENAEGSVAHLSTITQTCCYARSARKKRKKRKKEKDNISFPQKQECELVRKSKMCFFSKWRSNIHYG